MQYIAIEIKGGIYIAVITLGDSIATIITLGVILIPIIVIYKAYKHIEKRALEKLELEKQNTLILQNSIHDFNERLQEIEKTLKIMSEKR